MTRWPRRILFGDVDAMFASAAVVADPSLAGKPVAVGGPPPRGIITAASYFVRPFGIRSAMPTIQAMHLCPGLILVPPDRALYRRLHDAMRAATVRLFPVTEWTSIDEFYADTTDLQARYPNAEALGQTVKQALYDATGLRCTVAIATGKTVAKIAAEAYKPDGVAVIPPGEEAAFLARQPLRALPGVGPKTAARLDAFGLNEVRDLLDPRFEAPLRDLLGSRLLHFRQLAQGIDRDPVIPDRESKSLSHETTFERDTGDPAYLARTLRSFLTLLARDLREDGLAAAGFAVKLKRSDFVVSTKHGRFPGPLNYDPAMWPSIAAALRAALVSGTTYRLAGLALSGLEPASVGLYDARRAKAIAAMDAIAAKHGPSVIRLGEIRDPEDTTSP